MSMNSEIYNPVVTAGGMYPALHSLIIGIAMPNMVARQFYQPYAMTSGNAVSFTKHSGSPGAVADEISEGAEIPMDVTPYSNVVVTPKKVGQGFMITKETLEDGMIPVQQQELVRKTLKIANKIDKDCISALQVGRSGSTAATGKSLGMDGSEFTLSGSGGPGLGTYDITEAKTLVENNNFIPDTILCHPRVKKYIERLPHYTAAFSVGGNGLMNQGITIKGPGPFGTINGLDAFASTNCPTGSVFVLCRGASPNLSGVYAPLGFFVERRPITTEIQPSANRDSLGLFMTTRYGVAVLNGSAAAEITGVNVGS